MKDRWLKTNEFDKPEEFNAALFNLEFPFQYPLVTHPSTLLLFKGETNAVCIDFKFPKELQLEVNAKCGNFEVMISQHDLVAISQIMTNLTNNASAESSLEKSIVVDQSLQQSILEQSKQFRKNFAASLKEDSELRTSIEDMDFLEAKLTQH